MTETRSTPPSPGSSPPKPSKTPSDKPLRRAAAFHHPTKTTSRTTTTTVPNTSPQCLTTTAAMTTPAAVANGGGGGEVSWDDEFAHNLHPLPEGCHTTYRPLPLLLQIYTVWIAALVGAFQRASSSSFRPIVLAPARRLQPYEIVCRTLPRALLAFVAARTLLQDLYYPPSRTSVPLFPSRLSRYGTVTLGDDAAAAGGRDCRVHYLRYDNPSFGNAAGGRRYDNSSGGRRSSSLVDAVHCNHGFGASSLSFLPSLPSLVRRCGARVGTAHDGMGFGLTQRLKGTRYYSLDSSAAMGLGVLETEAAAVGPLRKVLLVGHSMGCGTTLRMAGGLGQGVECVLVLVAPALRVGRGREVQMRSWRGVATRFRPVGRLFRYLLFDLPLRYFLKRLVSAPQFWRRGLSKVWANPRRLSQNTVLSYTWPSLGEGWERGLVAFTRAQLGSDPGDGELLQQLLQRPNTTLVILHGDRDTVVPLKSSLGIRDEFGVEVKVLEGRGHNLFEEDVDSFLDEVETVLENRSV
mmetsp:Transcript_19926/g.24615  ORF Transcript_19926/g.24615 Transcript_19926/m.24615 type:complete len:520 (-) Transcript_19926:59-1618(-)